ncbi:MAG TPA: methylenetetrahydromethanopterin dehydrogenase, partial [Stellaceae bacterium]|nr:methylenetetrahydromethanopterin dehydrogenase [Stellaceae bacterium]
AVPPAGIEGVEVNADGAPLAGTAGLGIGALAIGNIKFQVQHALLKELHQGKEARFLDFRDAYRVARDRAQ